MHSRTGVTIGPLANTMLESLNVRRAVLSIAGADARGYYNSNLLLVETEQEMLRSADETIIVADSMKFVVVAALVQPGHCAPQERCLAAGAGTASRGMRRTGRWGSSERSRIAHIAPRPRACGGASLGTSQASRARPPATPPPRSRAARRPSSRLTYWRTAPIKRRSIGTFTYHKRQ